jgi:hypothetical protein
LKTGCGTIAATSAHKEARGAGFPRPPAWSTAASFQCPVVTASIASAVADMELPVSPCPRLFSGMADGVAMPLLCSSVAVDDTNATRAMTTGVSLATEVLQYDILNSTELTGDILLETVPAEIACDSLSVGAEYSCLSTLTVDDVNSMDWTVERRTEVMINDLLLSDCLNSPVAEYHTLTS